MFWSWLWMEVFIEANGLKFWLEFLEVHRGSDGNGRSSEVLTKALTLVRPISKLCFLEHDEQQVSDELD